MRLTKLAALLTITGSFTAFHVVNAQLAPTKPYNFSVDSDTQTPDGVLKPGSYTIRIADHLADRMVIEVHGTDRHVDEKFIGVPAKNFTAAGATDGPTVVTGAKGKSALRGFTFGRGNVVEFVYPKNDAVALAKTNQTTVLAIDPSSEGIPETKNLSADDLKIVTLWMLTPTPVGPDDKAGIKAAKYEAPAPVAPVEVASASAPARPGQDSASPSRADARPPVIHRLPKTGSDLPLLAIAGFCSLGLAVLLRFSTMRKNEL
jgi:LPXTG-motif cell wall-anchored protein